MFDKNLWHSKEGKINICQKKIIFEDFVDESLKNFKKKSTSQNLTRSNKDSP